MFLVEPKEPLVRLFSRHFEGRVTFEEIAIKDLFVSSDVFETKKTKIIVDISWNPNYLFIVNKIRKVYSADMELFFFLVNKGQEEVLRGFEGLKVLCPKSLYQVEVFLKS